MHIGVMIYTLQYYAYMCYDLHSMTLQYYAYMCIWSSTRSSTPHSHLPYCTP